MPNYLLYNWAFLFLLMNVLEKYKCLALIASVKRYKHNSALHLRKDEAKFAQHIGISYNTYTKYRGMCIQLGCAKKTHNQVIFVNLVKCIKILDIGFTRNNKFLTDANVTDGTFKAYYEAIRESVLLLNYNKQNYKIQQNDAYLEAIAWSTNGRYKSTNSDTDKRCKKLMRKLIKKAQYMGITTTSLINSMVENRVNNNIVTGKTHASRLLRVSESTARRQLIKMSKKGEIKRTVIKRVIVDGESNKVDYSNGMYDYLKVMNTTGKIVPISHSRTFMHYEGSRITFNCNSTIENINRKLPSKALRLKEYVCAL